MQKKPYNQGFSLSLSLLVFKLLQAKLHTRRFALTELFRRKLNYYWNTTHDSSPINNFNSSMKYSSFPIIVSSPEGSLTVNTPNF